MDYDIYSIRKWSKETYNIEVNGRMKSVNKEEVPNIIKALNAMKYKCIRNEYEYQEDLKNEN